jgi:hypothetical protein
MFETLRPSTLQLHKNDKSLFHESNLQFTGRRCIPLNESDSLRTGTTILTNREFAKSPHQPHGLLKVLSSKDKGKEHLREQQNLKYNQAAVNHYLSRA